MDTHDYYREEKWCSRCEAYVHYLASVQQSYCAQCGTPVRLFSQEDLRRFTQEVQENKWKYSNSG